MSVSAQRDDDATPDERLAAAGLRDRWEAALEGRDRGVAIQLLTEVGLGDQADWVVDTALADPARYWF